MAAIWATGRLRRLLCNLLRKLLQELRKLLRRLRCGLLPLVNILLVIHCGAWNANDLANMEVVRVNTGICINNVLHTHPILICDFIKCIALLNYICYHEIITSVSGYELIAARVIDAVPAVIIEAYPQQRGKRGIIKKFCFCKKRIDLRPGMLYTICRISVRHTRQD